MAGFGLMYIISLVLVFNYPILFPFLFMPIFAFTTIFLEDLWELNGKLWILFKWFMWSMLLYWAYVYLSPLLDKDNYDHLEQLLTSLYSFILMMGLIILIGSYQDWKAFKLTKEKISIREHLSQFSLGLGIVFFAIILFIISFILSLNPS